MIISRQMNKWWWLLHNSSAFPESPELNTTLGLLYIQTANHQVAKKYHQRYMEVAPRYMLYAAYNVDTDFTVNMVWKEFDRDQNIWQSLSRSAEDIFRILTFSVHRQHLSTWEQRWLLSQRTRKQSLLLGAWCSPTRWPCWWWWWWWWWCLIKWSWHVKCRNLPN